MNHHNFTRALVLSLVLSSAFELGATTSVQLPATPEACDRYLDPAKFNSVISRGKQFEDVIKGVKSHTIGINNSIDQVAAAIRPWFVTQAQSPTIFGVWGPPSGGKTSTIAEIIESLNAKLIYIDASKLSNGDSVTYHWNDVRVDSFIMNFGKEYLIEGLDEFELSDNLFVPRFTIPEHLAVFIDEIQSVRTRDDSGKEVARAPLQIFFEILARGGRVTVPNVEYRTLVNLITKAHGYNEYNYKKRFNEQNELKLISPEDAKKRTLSLIAYLEKRVAQTPPMITLDFSRALFIIAGNLFSIFPSNEHTSPSEVTVDDRNERSSAITETDIIGALRSLFMPQHVSRLGVTHVAFPSLKASSLRELIDTDLGKIARHLKQKERIDLEISTGFKDRLFQELLISGAEPRGLFGLYSSFIAQPITSVIEHVYANSPSAALVSNYQSLKINATATSDDPFALWTIVRDGQPLGEFKSPIPSGYSNLLKLANGPERERRALRVAARLVVDSMQLKRRASEVWANSLTDENMGYVEFHDIPDASNLRMSQTQSELMEKVAALVGPRVAELLVLGQPTDATSATMKKATDLAKEMVFNHAFPISGEFFLLVQSKVDAPKDREVLIQIDKVIAQAYQLAERWLKTEQSFFLAVTQRLTEVAVLNRQDLDLLYEHHWKTENLDPDKLALSQSDKMLQKFLSDPEMTLSLPSTKNPAGYIK